MAINRAKMSLLLFGSIALLSACGGGYGGGSGGYGTPMQSPPASVSISVAPTSITQGQTATLTWNASAGTTCTASGAWSGAQAVSGTLTVSPTTVGNSAFTLTCSGGTFSSNNASATLSVAAASAFNKSALVTSDGSVQGAGQDPFLINPWGIAMSSASTIWAADNGSQKSTLYDGTGVTQALIVSVAGNAGAANPTGIVFNAASATDFVVTNGTNSFGAAFIFAGEDGSISGWSPTVDGTHAIKMYSDPNGASFKGLAIAKNGTANFLYAADFHNNKIVILDRTYTAVTLPGGFVDATLPAGYAPFGIQAVQIQNQTRIVVTYAKQDATAHDEVPGAGFGLVNVFDTAGTLVKHLVAVGAQLNAPWGVALAPDSFGTLSNKLLIGNFGNGTVDAYDPVDGTFAGSINDANGAPITTPGLWGIAFGNGAHNQPKTTLFFFAGINGEAGGLYGRIDLGATAPDIVAPTVAITAPAPAAQISGTVPITVNAHDNVGVTQIQFFAGTILLGTVTNVPNAPVTFNWNSATTAQNGNINVTAQAKDAAGNVTVSTAVAVTVANPVVQFSTLYPQIFAAGGTGHCAGCHTGVGAALPGSMNLSTAADAYAALVNVTSVEQASLSRVKSGDAANSYLINKLEGTNLGTTSRMPLGGPFLDQPTIDSVKAWIAQGAQNN